MSHQRGPARRRGTPPALTGRRLGAVLVLLSALGVLAAPAAADEAALPESLRQAAEASPDQPFDVVVQATADQTTAALASTVDAVTPAPTATPADGVTHRFQVIDAVTATVTGTELLALAARPGVAAITADTPVLPSSFSNSQSWTKVVSASRLWETGLQPPTIAVVDSGVDGSRTDFAGRVLDQVDLTSGSAPNSPGDGFGHGTLVASLAAGSGEDYSGVAPQAPIVSLDVFADDGSGTVGGVIAAADWIYRHRHDPAYPGGIRVANFSLTSATPSSFRDDPLDRAVERLWLSGVVVVAAAGNYGSASGPSGVLYAPGNDPFVLTVGAADTNGTVSTYDDTAPSWSAWGATPDGFTKPEISAPGRQLAGAVPIGSSMYGPHPERWAAQPGYMWMSGTSFAAPIVAGSAAYVIAAHPDWTPDQVKGALMSTASPVPAAHGGSLGAGEVRGYRAIHSSGAANPNAGLQPFVAPDPSGGATPVFDAASWTSAAHGGAAWSSASWTSASWTSAWDEASWTSAAWTSGYPDDGSLPTATSGLWVP